MCLATLLIEECIFEVLDWHGMKMQLNFKVGGEFPLPKSLHWTGKETTRRRVAKLGGKNDTGLQIDTANWVRVRS